MTNSWSPLAHGLLAGKNRKSVREETDKGVAWFFKNKAEENTAAVVDRVVEVAAKKGLTPARVRRYSHRVKVAFRCTETNACSTPGCISMDFVKTIRHSTDPGNYQRRTLGRWVGRLGYSIVWRRNRIPGRSIHAASTNSHVTNKVFLHVDNHENTCFLYSMYVLQKHIDVIVLLPRNE